MITTQLADSFALQIKGYILEFCRDNRTAYLEYLQAEAAKGDKAAINELLTLEIKAI